MHWANLRVPGSSANLGPGFDTLGLALNLYLECRYRRATELSITVSGRDAESISCSADNLIWQTALRFGRIPPIELELRNGIPLGKGLGSSAAARTAGVVIASDLLGLQWTRARVLEEAARLEGHPDNVAASVLGGVTVSAMEESGCARALRLELPRSLQLAVIIPEFRLATPESRAALPYAYPREDVVFNIQRTALLVAALAANDGPALRMSFEDRIHQPCRAHLIPGLDRALRLKMQGLIGVVLSGAGPSVLVLFEQGRAEVCELVRQVLLESGSAWQVVLCEADRSGFQLST